MRDAARPGGILGHLVLILEQLQGVSGHAGDAVDASRPVETIWQGLVEPAVDGHEHGTERESPTSAISHELLPEYTLQECVSACSELVAGLGEASTLGPLVALLRTLVSEAGAAAAFDVAGVASVAGATDKVADGSDNDRNDQEVGQPPVRDKHDAIDPAMFTGTKRISAETVARLTKMNHVVSSLRVVLACLEDAGLYFSLDGAHAIVAVVVTALVDGHDVYTRRREAGIRHRERVRQLSVLLQLEIFKILLMMSRRYAEVFDEARTGKVLANVLVRVWVEGEDDTVPVSWVRDSASEMVRRESSLLQSVMSLMGSSLSLRFGKEPDDGRDEVPAGAHDEGTDGRVDRSNVGDCNTEETAGDGSLHDTSHHDGPHGGIHALDESAGPSPRVTADVSTGNEATAPPPSLGRKRHTNAYDTEHPLQTLSALLVLRLRFTVPAFQAGLQHVISPTLSSKGLLATFSKRMASSESSRLLMHVLLQNNSEFMNYCMSRTDVDVFVIPVLKRLHQAADQETTSMNEIYIMVILLLVFTGDKAFVMSANGSIVKDQDTTWYTTRNVKGIRLDSLMLLVLLRVGLVSTYSPTRRDVYLHTNTLATITNMAPTMVDMHPVACQRLLGVLEKLTTTEERINASTEQTPDSDLLDLVEAYQNVIFEVINAVIGNCLTNNVALVYEMLHKRSVIDRITHRGSNLKELSENARAVVDYFARLLPGEAPMEEIQRIISEGMASFQPEELPFDTSELLFGFEEEPDSALFFIRYIDDMLHDLLEMTRDSRSTPSETNN